MHMISMGEYAMAMTTSTSTPFSLWSEAHDLHMHEHGAQHNSGNALWRDDHRASAKVPGSEDHLQRTATGFVFFVLGFLYFIFENLVVWGSGVLRAK